MRGDEFKDATDRLRSEVPGVLAVLVATSDGMLQFGDLPASHGARTAALAATTLGLGRRISEDFGDGEFSEAVISSTDRHLTIYAVDLDTVLAAISQAGINLGLLHHYARRMCRDLAAVGV